MRILALLSLLGFAPGCGTIAIAVSLPGRVVDLTHPLEPGIPFFPGGEDFARRATALLARDGYDASSFATGEHTGTHVDAPSHFAAGQPSVDLLPADWLIGSVARIDVREAAARDPDYQLAAADLRAWEERHGALAEGCFVFVWTGWGERWGDPALYRNADAAGVMHFPGVSLEASRYLAERGVRCIGIDTLSTDPGPSQDFAQHKHFLGAGGYHVENLANLERLPPCGAVAIVAPLPIAGGSGAPARVLAFVPYEAEVHPH
jgi:kynurenine formamidase